MLESLTYGSNVEAGQCSLPDGKDDADVSMSNDERVITGTWFAPVPDARAREIESPRGEEVDSGQWAVGSEDEQSRHRPGGRSSR